MKQKDFTGIVPVQYTGNEIETDAFVDLKDDNEAKNFYEVVKERLLRVNNWHKIAGVISAKFKIMDASGNEVERNVQKGDYLKIDIPGPGSSEGEGYDWVCVEEVKEVAEGDMQSTGFRVRPSQNPFGEKNETAHFYSGEATSNFIVTHEGTRIKAWIVDRNIKPNTHADSLTDKIRDSAVGIGAIGMFSKVQWKGLAEGLVKKDD
jgi:hypothetical protein